MSVGNVTQAVDLERDSLSLVLGSNLDLGGDGSRNGTGKTTLINALSYGLYGNALTNIKKNNLINKTNGKGMLVTVDFEYNGTDYRIERGRSPNVFRLKRDGIDINDVEDEAQGEMRQTQVEVDSIIGISHSMFKHIVALNTYTEPFLSMRAGDQREIIEELLGITELSRKAECLRDEVKLTKEQIKDEEYRLKAIQDANERILKSIKDIERRQRVWTEKHTTDLSSLENALDSLSHIDIEVEVKNQILLVEYNENLAKVNEANRWLSSIDTDDKKQEKVISKLENEIALLVEHKCYACGQDMHDSKQEEILNAKNDQKKEAVLQITANDLQREEHSTIISVIGDLGTVPKVSYKSLQDAYEHQNSVNLLSEQIETKKKSEDPYADQINEMRDSSLEEIDYSTMNTLISFREHQDFLMKLLTNKDSFIRKKIIDQNLSFLNNRLESYLDKLGLPHEVRFQSDLTVEITELGRDLDFDNLSRGERNRLILGLSWAFRDIFESLYSTINVLFIDELIDSGMDTNGVEASLAVLKKMVRESGRSLFLVSHRDELVGRVSDVLNVVKENGFTTFTQEAEILEPGIAIETAVI
jgi:DNA repair exonuclease SbcCD ATPase subunit|tara:strand:- start:13177 stop:14940 length:1764 start_codon:yes stop_codon:yes gene_type:complete